MLSDSGVKLVIYIIWLHWKVWAEIRGGKPWHNSFSCLTPHLRKVNSYPAFLYRFLLFRRVLELEDKGKWKATSYIWTCFSSPFLHQIFFCVSTILHFSGLFSIFSLFEGVEWNSRVLTEPMEWSIQHIIALFYFSICGLILSQLHVETWILSFVQIWPFISFPIIHPVLSM